jgi:hypothetical protein
MGWKLASKRGRQLAAVEAWKRGSGSGNGSSTQHSTGGTAQHSLIDQIPLVRFPLHARIEQSPKCFAG